MNYFKFNEFKLFHSGITILNIHKIVFIHF